MFRILWKCFLLHTVAAQSGSRDLAQSKLSMKATVGLTAVAVVAAAGISYFLWQKMKAEDTPSEQDNQDSHENQVNQENQDNQDIPGSIEKGDKCKEDITGKLIGSCKQGLNCQKYDVERPRGIEGWETISLWRCDDEETNRGEGEFCIKQSQCGEELQCGNDWKNRKRHDLHRNICRYKCREGKCQDGKVCRIDFNVEPAADSAARLPQCLPPSKDGAECSEKDDCAEGWTCKETPCDDLHPPQCQPNCGPGKTCQGDETLRKACSPHSSDSTSSGYFCMYKTCQK